MYFLVIINEINERIIYHKNILFNDKYKKEYIFAIIGSVISKLNNDKKGNFIKNIISQIYKYHYLSCNLDMNLCLHNK